MDDFNNLDILNKYSFFDINIKTVIISNSLFQHIYAGKTAVININKKEIDVLCISNTFQYLTSHEGTCAIILNVSNAHLKSLCFSYIKASYSAHGTIENGGTCVSLNETRFDFVSLSLLRTNENDHASIYIHSGSEGDLKLSNVTNAMTHTGWGYTNGLRIWSHVSIQITFCAFANLIGGHILRVEDDVTSQSRFVEFFNATANKEYATIDSNSYDFHLDDCACISCANYIASLVIDFSRWYFSNCEPDSKHFIDVQKSYDKFDGQSLITVNKMCHVMKSNRENRLLIKLIGILFLFHWH